MSFSTWQDFFHMGGYAVYVWVSYGLTLAVLAAVLIAPVFRHRRLRQDMAQRARREQRDSQQPKELEVTDASRTS